MNRLRFALWLAVPMGLHAIAMAPAMASPATTPALPAVTEGMVSFNGEFLDTMMAHTRYNLALAELAATHATSAAVKTQASTLRREMDAEVAELQRLRNDLQITAPATVNEKLPGMLPVDMEGLQARKGTAFDKAWSEAMVQRLRGTVELARYGEQKAASPLVKTKASDIKSDTTKRITRMGAQA